jgi:hypothetical protein
VQPTESTTYLDNEELGNFKTSLGPYACVAIG